MKYLQETEILIFLSVMRLKCGRMVCLTSPSCQTNYFFVFKPNGKTPGHMEFMVGALMI